MKKFLTSMVLLLMSSALANAAPITFVGTGVGTNTGNSLAASVTFDSPSVGTFSVLLSNLSANNPGYMPGDALMGVFFDTTFNLNLNPISADPGPGSVILGASAIPIGDNLGNYFQYLNNPAGFSGGLSTLDKYGISGIGGSGMFGPGGNFSPGPTFVNLDGVDAAIVGNDYSDAL